jgi:hypothetical protein
VITYEALLPDGKRVDIDAADATHAGRIARTMFSNHSLLDIVLLEKQWIVKRCRHYVYKDGEFVQE